MSADTSPPTAAYELLDFGDGSRLERWGHHVLVRPEARATAPPADPSIWDRADAAFQGRIGGGRWHPRPGRAPLPDRWTVAHAGLQFQVGCAPSGHTGLFPEQAAHWAWMRQSLPTSPDSDGGGGAETSPDFSRPKSPDSLRVLNLFAYTGGASVALARAGARVTHVDASRPAIGWAQENARLNGVTTVRWIQEDARRFVDRERRRGRRYDGLLLDPPAFGRGPAGDWQLERDLPDLLDAAAHLLEPDPAFVLLNVYTGEQDAATLERLLAWALDRAEPAPAPLTIEAGTLALTAADGRSLPTGIFARAARRGATPRDTNGV